uniref:(northern house mosquito) hypothetical protein n=1 Tax=Culex pipiens TaxID=7175 RepID=A0A8D8N1M0_CULPI
MLNNINLMGVFCNFYVQAVHNFYSARAHKSLIERWKLGNFSTEFTEHVSHMICFLLCLSWQINQRFKSDYEFSIVSACGMSLYEIWKPTVFWVISKVVSLNDSIECGGFSLSPIRGGLHNTILYCFTFFYLPYLAREYL